MNMIAAIAELKQQVQQSAERIRDLVLEISHTIHANPELAFKEYQAAALLTDTLEQHGFSVERGSGGLETAFTATYQQQDGGPDRVAPGLAHLFTFGVDCEAMGQHACIGSAAGDGNTGHDARLKPAAVLVRTLEVQISRPA